MTKIQILHNQLKRGLLQMTSKLYFIRCNWL